MTRPTLEPTEALDRIFAVIRDEAAANPVFARRLLDAAGVTVTFRGAEAAKVVDPVIAAAHHDYATFREMMQTFTEAQVKKMLGDFGLATKEEIARVTTKPKKSGFIDLLWDGARRRLAERGR